MRLIRVSDNGIATYGVLLQGNTPFAVTLERPWRGNQRGISCILPAPGDAPREYVCQRMKSPRFGETFQVMNVPGRSEILFHKGNIDDDTHGCILVGEQFNPVLGKPGITASKDGFGELMNLLRITNSFVLTIGYADSLVGVEPDA